MDLQQLLKAKKAMELSENRRPRLAHEILPGEVVWLRHIATMRPSSKLDVRRLGPFSVIGPLGKSAYHLDLPSHMQIHPVFHVSLQNPHVSNSFPGCVEEGPEI